MRHMRLFIFALLLLTFAALSSPAALAQAKTEQPATTTYPDKSAVFTEPERTRPVPVQTSQAAVPQQANSVNPWDRFKGAIDRFIGFIPALLGGLITLLIGWVIAKVLKNIALRLVPRTGIDGFLKRRGLVGKRSDASDEEQSQARREGGITDIDDRARAAYGRVNKREEDLERRYPASGWIASAIFWFVMLSTVAQVAYAWNWNAVGNGISRFLAYVPHLIAAAVIFGITLVIADWVRDRVVGESTDSRADLVGGGVRAVILTFGGFLALRELQIAPDIVRIAFTLILGAIAVATALAFGLGGRQAVERMTTDMYDKTAAQPSRRKPSQVA